MVVVFAGHASARFLARWRPETTGNSYVIVVEQDSKGSVEQNLAAALDAHLPAPKI
jgi:hypothetical protein